jgi:hypothetical protein
MPLEDTARQLVRARIAFDAAKARYDEQRIAVHNAPVNAQQDSIAIDGYRITHSPDTVARSLNRELLNASLLRHSIPEPTITAILTESTKETPRSGDIIMRRLPEPADDE